MTGYFVTGATGNVGSTVVRRLLRDPAAQIWVLIRARSDVEIKDRLQRLFDLWCLSEVEAVDAAARLHPVVGDMGRLRFGLSGTDWDVVGARCDRLVHAAGVVKMNLPLEEARRHAVGSAENLIALADSIASSGREVDVAFVSTVGVAGKQSVPLRDHWVSAVRAFHNTYEQSKAEAEDLLRAWNRGSRIRLTVHRPSMVVGASDGALLRHQIFFYICEFLSGRHTKGLQPALNDARLDTVPVDYVAEAVCWAVRHPEVDGRVFNLCSGPDQEVGLAAVQDWTRQTLLRKGHRLPRVRSVPAWLFLAMVRAAAAMASTDVRKRLGTLPVLIGYLNAPPVFDGRESRRLLSERAGLVLPAPELYLPGVIRDLCS